MAAVLVAIAIPVFTTQLEKSKEGTDIANLRSAYAAGQVAALTGQYGDTDLGSTSSLYFNPSADGSLDATGVAIGQGTATNGKYDLSGIGGGTGMIKYNCETAVKGNKIKVSFASGAVSAVEFVSGT